MVSRLFYALVIVVLLAAFAAPALAQEVTPEATPTPEQPPVVVVTPETGINLATIIYGIIVAVLGGGSVALVLTRFGSNKANLDAMEKLYLSFPPATQDVITRVTDVLVNLTDILQKVTDKLPNEETPVRVVMDEQPPSFRSTNVGPGRAPDA